MILNDSSKAARFVLLLSLLRLVNPKYFMPEEYSTYLPLEYAVEQGRYIALGHGLYVAPVSESFRGISFSE